MELRARYAEASSLPDDDLGCMNVTFSVEAETLQEVEHSHFFSLDKSPLCMCPSVFNPPPFNMTWTVRVRLTPGDEDECQLDEKLNEIEASAGQLAEEPFRQLRNEGMLLSEDRGSLYRCDL